MVVGLALHARGAATAVTARTTGGTGSGREDGGLRMEDGGGASRNASGAATDGGSTFRERWPCASTEVSYFAYIGWKLETSGNENGNFDYSDTKKCIFIGKSERARKLGKSGRRKLRGVF